MSEEFLEESDGDAAVVKAKKAKESEKTSLMIDMMARQAPFLELIQMFHKLFDELPNLTARDVDARLGPMFDKLMDASAVVGISRNSVPSLKECCGKKRIWPGELGESGITPTVGKIGMGDLVKKLTTILGIKSCEGCERRRRWLNSIRWPWQKK